MLCNGHCTPVRGIYCLHINEARLLIIIVPAEGLVMHTHTTSATVWNNLPDNVRNIDTLYAFKQTLKQFSINSV